MLSIAAQQYKNNGYYVARDVLPKKYLKNTLLEMDIILIQQLNRLGINEQPTDLVTDLYSHMRQLYTKDQFTYVQVLKLWVKLFSMQALVMHEKIKLITKELGNSLPVFQTTPVLHVMADDLKITNGYHGVGVHQDWPAIQSSLDAITVWFPFMDVNINNYPLELIPGSHTFGLYPGKIAEHIFEVDPNFYNEKNFIPMELHLGDVLFMSTFTLHRSSLNGQDLRIACSSRYENASEKTFIDRIYPSAQKRVVQRELIQPDFPKQTHLENIFARIK